ncbi:ATP-binding protein [Streptomyces sp. NPDC001787]|uniref:ATP-binding protein n=1 Tax=Streptomyces sp. NPDC001787 TaxID=3154523 RepID=UPI00331FE817
MFLGGAWGAEAFGSVPAGWAVAVGVAGSAGAAAWGARRAARFERGLRQQSDAAAEEARKNQDGLLREVEQVVTDGRRELDGVLASFPDGDRSAARSDGRLTAAADRGQQTVVILQEAFRDARNALGSAAQAQRSASQSQLQIAALVYIARRLQSLQNRALTTIADLVDDEGNPGALHGYFDLEHLVILMRRQSQSLSVLGGQPSRTIQKPVSVPTVLRQAGAEIELYSRVKSAFPSRDLAVPGFAAAEIIHLLAELLENATRFSPPETLVMMRASEVPAGLVIDVEDRGLPMAERVRSEWNQVLSAPEAADLGQRLKDGRLGLLVVGHIAKRFGVTVELLPNSLGGNTVRVVLPGELLVTPVPLTVSAPAKAARTGTAPVRRIADPSHDAAVAVAFHHPAVPGTAAARPATPLPVAGAVPAGKPALPRRQGHAPQAPAPAPTPRRATGNTSGKSGVDPGLMATFAEGARSGFDDPVVPGDRTT